MVHLSGGASALVAAIMLGSRLGRFTDPEAFEMSSPVTALTGTFMLWWAWLAFNCGSTFGISNNLWQISAMVAVNTINGSIGPLSSFPPFSKTTPSLTGGALAGMALSVLLTMRWKEREWHLDIGHVIQGVLGGLVGITASCAVIVPRDALLIGAIGGSVGVLGVPALEKVRVDDPVGAVSVHLAAAVWSTVAVGLFGRDFYGQLEGKNGLFYGGGWRLLAVQMAGAAAVAAWASTTTALIFLAMKATIGVRMSLKVSPAPVQRHSQRRN